MSSTANDKIVTGTCELCGWAIHADDPGMVFRTSDRTFTVHKFHPSEVLSENASNMAINQLMREMGYKVLPGVLNKTDMEPENGKV